LQIYERNPTTVKNYGIWVRYQSRTGYHNAYKVRAGRLGWVAV
jgi:large subunit ribosomal protein L18Ae